MRGEQTSQVLKAEMSDVSFERLLKTSGSNVKLIVIY